ncbi:hypothetical protein IGI04_014577 [Brassica rapa subsp. trilocularis]|uniref:BZIP domain-containing protein n=2 Tax=Brassica campestris TaxID=3711 RepID=M4DE83_BRACM|nr:hypothetical protein IGI04_014577 [Brassica rapa subsp. trilocularis]
MQPQPQPHISPTSAQAAISAALKSQRLRKNRGSYSCGRCGQPKKGHVCHLPPPPLDVPATPIAPEPLASVSISAAASSSTRPPAPSRQPFTHLRRALSFDDDEARDSRFHAAGLWEVLKRLPPSGLLMAARVCRGWRETAGKMWKAAEELRIRVPERAQIGYVGSLLQKCPALVRLSLKSREFDATTIACIAFSCPNLEVLEISTYGAAVNRISGDELGRFVSNKRGLRSLKMEGCSSLGGFTLASTSLSTLWLADLHSLSKMIFNCPNLIELSLEFSLQEDDSTDLVAMIDGLGRTCTRLQNIHIASLKLSHTFVLALTAVNFRDLRMLSLVLGIDITDASVAAISSTYTNLELLDLSGSSITDTGLGMICDALPDTLSKLLVALCPNITSSGIQFATAQLPLLELMDCGMSVSDPTSDNLTFEEKSSTPQKASGYNQKMFIKHKRLKKLSLWGGSSLDALFLNCPELKDLNLNSCSNLQPESLVLQCPKLELVSASGCQNLLIGAIRKQVSENFAAGENHMPLKRLADASKRIQAPPSLYQEHFDKFILLGSVVAQTSPDASSVRSVPSTSIQKKLDVPATQATSISSRDDSDDDDLDGDADNGDPTDVKRARRMLSNRESARRSRRRKQEQMNEFDTQAGQLRGEHSTLLSRLSDMNHKCDAAAVDNRILRADIETLRTKVKMVEETVKRVTGVNPLHWARPNMGTPLNNTPSDSSRILPNSNHVLEPAIPSTTNAGLASNQRVERANLLPEQVNREGMQNQFATNPNLYETLLHWNHKH